MNFNAELARVSQTYADTLRAGMDFGRNESARRVAELEAEVLRLRTILRDEYDYVPASGYAVKVRGDDGTTPAELAA